VVRDLVISFMKMRNGGDRAWPFGIFARQREAESISFLVAVLRITFRSSRGPQRAIRRRASLNGFMPG
jgi:hypothetical protein